MFATVYYTYEFFPSIEIYDYREYGYIPLSCQGRCKMSVYGWLSCLARLAQENSHRGVQNWIDETRHHVFQVLGLDFHWHLACRLAENYAPSKRDDLVLHERLQYLCPTKTSAYQRELAWSE